ncbi:MAG: hypothetical protein RLZ83_348, partial [Pseudomonadota bacterium]
MSQTRKQRPQRAQPRRPTKRDAVLGSLTLGALWALAAQADRGAEPTEDKLAADLAAGLRSSHRAAPLTSDSEAGTTSTVPAEVSTLSQELRRLVAGLEAEAAGPRTPARAPAPDGLGLLQPVDGPTVQIGTASTQGHDAPVVASRQQETAVVGDAAASSAGQTAPDHVVVADTPAESSGSASGAGADVIVVEAAAAPPAVAAGGLSTSMLLGAVAGVSALVGLAGKGLTAQAPTAPTPAAPPPPPAPSGPATVAFDARVIDGYVKGATVFYDADADGVLDAGEVSTVTDDQGNFELTGVTPSANGRIVVLEGGTDIETGNPVGRL